MNAGTKCSHCEEVRHCRCSYADCPWEVDQADEFLVVKNVEIARLQEQVETLRRERDEALRSNRFAQLERLAILRAEAAEAERDRLRAALEKQDEADRLLEEGDDVAAMLAYADAKALRLAALQKEPQP